MILPERAARREVEACEANAEAARDQSRSSASNAEAFIAHLKIEKLKRALYGVSSERKQRLLDQFD